MTFLGSIFIYPRRSDLSDNFFIQVTCRFSAFSLSYPVLIVAVSPCFSSKAFNLFTPIEEPNQKCQVIAHINGDQIEHNHPQITRYGRYYFLQETTFSSVMNRQSPSARFRRDPWFLLFSYPRLLVLYCSSLRVSACVAIGRRPRR